MRVKNDQNLLQPVFDALSLDSYDAGDSDLTPTSWIDSPRIRQLMKEHWDEIEELISDRVFTTIGNGVHNLLEENVKGFEGVTAEERVFYDHPSGLRLSGAIDLQMLADDGSTILADYKTTSVWSVILGSGDGAIKPAWVRQLNSYRYLLQISRDVEVSALYIIAILRDWKRGDSVKPSYPDAPIVQIEVPLWGWEETQAYVEERIALHREASYSMFIKEELVHCTSEEMWERPETFAVLRSSSHKRASRVLDSMEDATAWAENPDNGMGSNHVIEHRPGQRVRCRDWCQVAKWCNQYQEYLENLDDDF